MQVLKEEVQFLLLAYKAGKETPGKAEQAEVEK